MTPEGGPLDADYCYLTTTGRVTGRPHTVELWFAFDSGAVYLMHDAEVPADWVRNLVRTPAVGIRFAARDATEWAATAHLPEPGAEADVLARRLLVAKYQARWESDLSEWGRTAIVVQVDLPREAMPDIAASARI